MPIAYEGALKMKEISYIHAEAYPAGEMKHGPIALVDNEMPVVAIAPNDPWYEKMISQIEQAKARGGNVLMVASEGDERANELSDDVFWVPETPWLLSPVITVIPLADVCLSHGFVARVWMSTNREIWQKALLLSK